MLNIDELIDKIEITASLNWFTEPERAIIIDALTLYKEMNR